MGGVFNGHVKAGERYCRREHLAGGRGPEDRLFDRRAPPGPGPAQDGHRPALASGAVDLPSEGALSRDGLDDSMSIRPDERRVQAPLGLTVANVRGNIVTLAWTPPPLGPAATSYVVEGGVAAGQTLAVLPTGGPSPTFTFSAPTGSFYVRLRTIAGAEMSGPSNEVRLYVGMPVKPSAPTNVQAAVKGSALWLAWRKISVRRATGTRPDVIRSAST